MLVYQTK